MSKPKLPLTEAGTGSGIPTGGEVVVTGWVTWPRQVQAGCYRDAAALDLLHRWVGQLRDRGRIKPAIQFSIEADADVPVGVLFDPDETLARWAVLRPGGYLVFTGDTLVVLDERTFHAAYCDPAHAPGRTVEPGTR